jgi:hypothetical protein
VDHSNEVRFSSCTVTENGGLTGCTALLTTVGTWGSTYLAPQVGFYGNRAWIATRASGGLVVGSESATFNDFDSFVPDVYSAAIPTGGIAYSPSIPQYTPYTYKINSGLPPIMWSRWNDNQISFSANSGGNLFGWGWSSNFGWVSLNCANQGLPSPVCANPYGVNIAAPPVDNTPQQRTTGFPSLVYNPYGYPLSGFGWSSNAGWMTFDRYYSVSAANPNGRPPGQDYNLLSVSTDPIAKYVPSTQYIHGWGRFLNLCNFSGGKCQNTDGGWVHMKGYWINPTKQTTVSAAGYTAGGGTIPVSDCSKFLTNPGLGLIGPELFDFTGCAANTLSIFSDRPLNSYPAGTLVSNVTNQPYGVQAYWTGSNYEPYGWAWSEDYGWIRFRPQIFAGFAWLETLFGNIYVSGNTLGDPGNVQLPNPQYVSGQPIMECGTGSQNCYVATYRIETTGIITAMTTATGQASGLASSALEDSSADIVGRSIHLIPNNSLLDPLLTRDSLNSGTPPSFGFPAVNPGSVTYSNALGKIDVGALKGFVDVTASNQEFIGANGPRVTYGHNRLGQELLETQITNAVPPQPQDWNVTELANQPYYGYSGNYGWPVPPVGLESLRNQVVHVQGDLTVNGAYAKLSAALAAGYTTISVNSIAGTSAPVTNFPKNGGTLVIEQGVSGKEEYVKYASFNGTIFSGVTKLDGSPTIAHTDLTNVSAVRWVWQIPFVSCVPPACSPKAQNTTVIVDGDLNIKYNIITESASVGKPASNIRDVPTIAFIVYGNVIIDNTVNKVTGAYIVLGRDSTKTPGSPCASCSGYPDYGGVFSTGDDETLCLTNGTCNPLKITGLLFARAFDFQRIGNKNLISPGEQVTSDSNLFLNPPPGLEDATKLLPQIQRVGQ